MKIKVEIEIPPEEVVEISKGLAEGQTDQLYDNFKKFQREFATQWFENLKNIRKNVNEK